MNNEQNYREKLIMTYGFLKGLASKYPKDEENIKSFTAMLRFDDLLPEDSPYREVPTYKAGIKVNGEK